MCSLKWHKHSRFTIGGYMQIVNHQANTLKRHSGGYVVYNVHFFHVVLLELHPVSPDVKKER